MNHQNLTWKDVLVCKKWYGHIGKMVLAAQETGYKFICWNDRIYDVGEPGDDAWIDTGFLAIDIKG